MMDVKLLNEAIAGIDEATPEQLAHITLAVIDQLGAQGREGREAIIDRINADRCPDTDEGLAQLADVIAATE